MDEASGMDNFINLRLDGVEIAFCDAGDISSWNTPRSGVLSFDYVATKRVPKEAKPQRYEVNRQTIENRCSLFVITSLAKRTLSATPGLPIIPQGGVQPCAF